MILSPVFPAHMMQAFFRGRGSGFLRFVLALRCWLYHFSLVLDMTMLFNKSPEPTPVGAVRSAARFTVFGLAWLSFFRSAASHDL